MTGSCNCSGYAVFYIFYYNNGMTCPRQNIRYRQIRSNSWDDAAKQLDWELRTDGIKAGQIISIDAHNNDNDGQAMFSVFSNASLPALGELSLKFESKNDQSSWEDHYRWACYELSSYGPNEAKPNVHSITSSCNESGRGVTYVFVS